MPGTAKPYPGLRSVLKSIECYNNSIYLFFSAHSAPLRLHIQEIPKMIKIRSALISAILCAAVIPVTGDASSIQELQRQCEAAREVLIAPLRQEAIDTCIADRTSGRSGTRSSRDARDHCERFYADFGQGNATRAGGFQQRMFHDIPECQALYEAERRR